MTHVESNCVDCISARHHSCVWLATSPRNLREYSPIIYCTWFYNTYRHFAENNEMTKKLTVTEYNLWEFVHTNGVVFSCFKGLDKSQEKNHGIESEQCLPCCRGSWMDWRQIQFIPCYSCKMKTYEFRCESEGSQSLWSRDKREETHIAWEGPWWQPRDMLTSDFGPVTAHLWNNID